MLIVKQSQFSMVFEVFKKKSIKLEENPKTQARKVNSVIFFSENNDFDF